MRGAVLALRKWGALCLPILLFSTVASAQSEKTRIVPPASVKMYCKKAGCDNQFFYRFYANHRDRFCEESRDLLSQRRHSMLLGYLVREASKAGLPATVAVLPIIESSLDPRAVASKGTNAAKGLWQFKPGAAKDMGLSIGHRYDERLDLRLSTDAGLRYLKWLESEFDGNHALAVLAYHLGIGNVQKMIAQYGTKNPWYLSKLNNVSLSDKEYLQKYFAYSLALMKKGCK